jgi:hypothetical protein
MNKKYITQNLLNELSNTNMFIETLFTDFMNNKDNPVQRNSNINSLVQGYKLKSNLFGNDSHGLQSQTSPQSS